jgi:hypothetical protein
MIHTPRARRMPLPIPITYRRVGQASWEEGRVLNISESGVLFGPTTLNPGAEVEVIFSTPVPVGTIGPGRLVCVGEVVRTTDTGETGARFVGEPRFLLEN